MVSHLPKNAAPYPVFTVPAAGEARFAKARFARLGSQEARFAQARFARARFARLGSQEARQHQRKR